MPDKPRAKLKLMFGKLNANMHGPNHSTIRGPKLTHVKLESVCLPSTGHRFYFYFHSGKGWYMDAYFDRRNVLGMHDAG